MANASKRCTGSRSASGRAKAKYSGLKWTDFDFSTGKVRLSRALQRVKRPGDLKSHLEEVDTKTPESKRTIWLPQIAIEKILAHQRRQAEERIVAGSAWIETGMVFTTKKGTPLEPRNMLRDFFRIRDRANCLGSAFTIYGTPRRRF